MDTRSSRALGGQNQPLSNPGAVLRQSLTARIPSKLREELCGPNFMVQQIGDILVFNVYLLPETSIWAGELECDHCLALTSSIALADNGRFQILIMGDLNGRTGNRTVSALDTFRNSLDQTISTRGRFLLKLCGDYHLMTLNGIEHFGPNSGAFTFFQGTSKTVIDYVICSK
ncbi:hypothetical protein K438DRAFT_1972969 [Mycena galopus ATCC 62051]|nr:hypothetical protein K438DRAFT_1972969 [Mycena galopus ATCC 62051]